MLWNPLTRNPLTRNPLTRNPLTRNPLTRNVVLRVIMNLYSTGLKIVKTNLSQKVLNILAGKLTETKTNKHLS